MNLKQKILLELLSNPSQSISGQVLCKKYNVSRTAIWKAIQSLKQDGYAIEAVPHAGYHLIQDIDKLDAARIQFYLPHVPVLVFDSIDSTNNYAKRLLMENDVQEGTLIVANQQTAGRGRQGHSFYSPADTGLYLSIILKPYAFAQKILKVTLAAAVATCEAIEEMTSISCQIKWVNDLFVGQQKVCGILTEATANFETQQIESIIIGIGINCKPMTFPEDITPIAGSLNMDQIDRNHLSALIWTHFMKWVQHLDDQKLIESYRSRSLLIGKTITYRWQNKIHTGTVIDINEDGQLVVQTNDQIQVLRSGEVTIQKW
ncbi:biotin--[acetyl-CoA-carboxylase] ligase [Absicoccus intestinalis]|uniref:Bifunctional ligase/repressor BirA n=1 Tax=Absicoccus intestinalis TaxID=2926319 RepID=A0ABU4WRY4_9FIRM|nr:biotin--[acetyl-CoA-carboxylase] ligase [Absicoccus sp. CLA-KB-P134]MDX8418270.1 biotin--[acetyl-CoA-carboxylase] ligase [Absicoccus sp. CLA-KB-P134]